MTIGLIVKMDYAAVSAMSRRFAGEIEIKAVDISVGFLQNMALEN